MTDTALIEKLEAAISTCAPTVHQPYIDGLNRAIEIIRQHQSPMASDIYVNPDLCPAADMANASSPPATEREICHGDYAHMWSDRTTYPDGHTEHHPERCFVCGVLRSPPASDELKELSPELQMIFIDAYHGKSFEAYASIDPQTERGILAVLKHLRPAPVKVSVSLEKAALLLAQRFANKTGSTTADEWMKTMGGCFRDEAGIVLASITEQLAAAGVIVEVV